MYEELSQEKIRPIRQFLLKCREKGKLNLSWEEKVKFSEIFKEQTQIAIDFSQKSPFSVLEIIIAATWFLAEKYTFRAEVLGLSVGTVKSHENRIKVKLGLWRSAHAYCWFVNKKIICMQY